MFQTFCEAEFQQLRCAVGILCAEDHRGTCTWEILVSTMQASK